MKKNKKNVVFSPAISALLVFLSAFSVAAQEASDASQLRMLGQCQACSFEGLDLTESKLTGVDLKESTLRAIDFAGANLSIALFDFAVIENVSFNGANLGGASFRGARLVNVTFEGADLKAAVFEDAILEATDITAGRLCNTQMPNETTDNTECD
ncbi:pentapeptide repeat-containing protein [Pararhodobacter marinus]|nr:pentapeptide repeat-containing protein [Pararhodobacter marinus]